MKERGRKLEILDNEIICMYKTVEQAISTSLFFHNHDGYELLILLDGELDLYWDGGGRKLTRGDLACIAPYAFHGAVLQTPGCYDRICINIRESFLPLLSSDRTDFVPLFSGQVKGEPNWQHFSDEELGRLVPLTRRLQQALEGQEWGDDLLSQALLTELLILIGRHSGITDISRQPCIMPDLVTHTFAYINSHLTKEISLDSLAASVHHNSSYIGRCFKKITGTTVNQYIILKRVALAQQYLREGRSLSEVCYMAGFQNYSHFSRTFRAHTGLSPRQYQTEYAAHFDSYKIVISKSRAGKKNML